MLEEKITLEIVFPFQEILQLLEHIKMMIVAVIQVLLTFFNKITVASTTGEKLSNLLLVMHLVVMGLVIGFLFQVIQLLLEHHIMMMMVLIQVLLIFLKEIMVE